MTIIQDLVRELFDYRNGNLYWEVSGSGRKISKPAGYVDNEGYKIIRMKGKSYRAHRLIFLYHYGYLPQFIDHIDGNPSNNSIDNLRKATSQENQWNSKKKKSINGEPTSSKYKGVTWHKQDKKWQAQIGIDGKRKFLGYFISEIEAARAYDRMATEAFGEFAKPNFDNKSKGL